MDAKLEAVIEEAVQGAVSKNILVDGLMTSAIIIAVILALRFFLTHLVKGKKEILNKEQRRWINRINNSTSVFAILVLVFIWAPQLHTFALSLTAVAVAVVLTTREILMCLTGGFLCATTKPYDIGDWITVEGTTGEVMRITALVTTIEEVDIAGKTYQFTGRTIQIPNSKFLTSNIENANFVKNHVYYDVPITLSYEDLDANILMEELVKITEKYFAPYMEDAIKFNKKVEKKAAVDFADPEPQFFIRTTDIGDHIYTVRFFVPTQEAARIGSDITRDFLSYFHKTKSKGMTKKAA